MEQRVEVTLQAWSEPFIRLRAPLIFNLRRDPYERSQKTSNTYYDWRLDRVYLLLPAAEYVENLWQLSSAENQGNGA